MYRDLTPTELIALVGQVIQRTESGCVHATDVGCCCGSTVYLSGVGWVTATQLRTDWVYRTTGLPVAGLL